MVTNRLGAFWSLILLMGSAGCTAEGLRSSEEHSPSPTTVAIVTTTEGSAIPTVVQEPSSAPDWLADYGFRFEQALDDAETITAKLRGEASQTECQDLQERWDPVDRELNDLIDLMPAEMTTLGDALYVAVSNVDIALSLCALGQTGASLQQQLDFYDLDRAALSDVAKSFGWDL